MELVLLFANWSSFSHQMPSPFVSNFRGFSLNHGGGGWGELGKVLDRVSHFQQDNARDKSLVAFFVVKLQL